MLWIPMILGSQSELEELAATRFIYICKNHISRLSDILPVKRPFA